MEQSGGLGKVLGLGFSHVGQGRGNLDCRAGMGRFADPQDPLFQALNASIAFDYRLAPYDIEQSLAHARMLASSQIIGEDDLEQIEKGLAAVREEIEADSFLVQESDEDIHMAIERRLTEIVGAAGGKLHTARSRNDQVATDVAMLVRAHSLEARSLLLALMATLVDRAERHLDWPLPGYTHLQRAQPVYLSHHLLAWFWKFRRDLQRFNFCMTATDDLPLGAGALAGVNFATGRMFVAQELGFNGIAENSLDAVSNRDFVLDYLSAAATCAGHLSQMGGEVVLWSTAEFGFCRVADAFASGSSLMPQKKNPDAAELLRAKAPRIVGGLVTVHGMLHGLPLTYNKDLQEDKEPLFAAIDTLELCLRVAREMLAGIEFDRERMAIAAGDEFVAATDLADLLVRDGIPFREAHGIVGGLVRAALERDKALSELTDEELAQLAPQMNPEGFRSLLDERSWLESKVSEGGTSLARVNDQLAQARHVLDEAGAA
jgi:argininosuccinate lyase